MTHPVPTDQTVGTSSEVQPFRNSKRPPVTLQDAEAAARALGLDVVNAKSLQNAGIIGDFLKEVGAISIGRAKLAINLGRVERALEFIEDRLPGVDDPEVLVGMLKVQADFIGKSNHASELLIKSAQQAAETAKAEASLVLPGFVPGARVGPTPAGPSVAVQVNVSGDSKVSVSEDQPEDPE